jgi:hypothetical protein|nr:MAG TPA: short tail fiber protein [Caudoviricetes sp.]
MGKTLKKLQYNSLSQFVEDINRNFAVIQNSPLYKGIPGDPGEPGSPGKLGTRGSRFFFLKTKINDILSLTQNDNMRISDINLDFINFLYEKNIGLFYGLFPELKDTGFVSNDIIVLPNSMMIQFNKLLNVFESTGMSFNENQTFLSSVENKIETYVKNYVNKKSNDLEIQNIFERYSTYGKNYASTSHMTISNTITSGTVLTPHLGNNTSGIRIETHKYFGFSDKEFPINNSGTIVFGSMRNFTKIVEQTITSSGQNSTSSSKYAIGIDNIPTAIFLQDTGKAGIMIGYKNWKNLNNFASIYKEITGTNTDGPLVIKSNMGSENIDYSKLSIDKNQLTYDKFAKFLDNLEVKKDLIFGEHIQSTFMRSGEYLPKQTQEQLKKNTFEFGYWDGKSAYNGSLKNQFENISYKHFLSNVLVTDENGNLSKLYSLENKDFTDIISSTNIDSISWRSQAPDTNIVTSKYLNKIIEKLNAIQTYVSNNYWTKVQWADNPKHQNIPKLSIKELNVNGTDTGIVRFYGLNDVLGLEFAGNTLTLGNTNIPTVLKSGSVKLTEFDTDTVLTVGNNKLLDKSYVRETRNISTETDLDSLENSFVETNKYLTSYYFGQLIRLIKENKKQIEDNYWSRRQFRSGEIDSLKVARAINIGDESFISKTSLKLIGTNSGSATNLGRIAYPILHLAGTEKLQLSGKKIIFGTGSNKNVILTTNDEGALDYSNKKLNIQLPDDYTLPELENPENYFLTYNHFKWLTKKLSDASKGLSADFWSKNEFTGFNIPSLQLKDNLDVKGNVSFGPTVNPFIRTNDSAGILEIGKTGNTSKVVFNNEHIVFKAGHKSCILGTNASGELVDLTTSTVENSNTVIPKTTEETPVKIEIAENQKQDNVVVTGKQLNLFVNLFNSIKLRFKNTFNRKETIDTLYDHMPVGSIIMWTYASSQAAGITGKIPKGWAVCDGSNLPNSTIATPNMEGMFVRGTNDISETNEPAEGLNSITLSKENLPDLSHTHTMSEDSGQHIHAGGNLIIKDSATLDNKYHGRRENGLDLTNEVLQNIPLNNADILFHNNLNINNNKGLPYAEDMNFNGGGSAYWRTNYTAWFNLNEFLTKVEIKKSGEHTHLINNANPANPTNQTREQKPINILPLHCKVIYIMKFDTRKKGGTDFNEKYILDEF